MNVDDVRRALSLLDSWDGRLSSLDAVGPPQHPVTLPSGDELIRLLDRLHAPEVDREEITLAFTVLDAEPAWRWLLERSVQMLRARMGTYYFYAGGPSLPAHTGTPGAYFYVAVFCGVLPDVQVYRASRGIPDDDTWAIMADLGEKLEMNRRRTGRGGMAVQFWFTYHERGIINSVGRLQFNLDLLPFDIDSIDGVPAERGGGQRAGEPCVSVHIPQRGGPLAPDAVDAALARIRPFLARHFPEHPAEVAVCDSWLLDPQLGERLPPTSNVVRFGQRFTRWPLRPDAETVSDSAGVPATGGDRSVLEFVFRRGERPLAELPRSTSMERAALDHLAAGRHWHQHVGWLPLP